MQSKHTSIRDERIAFRDMLTDARAAAARGSEPVIASAARVLVVRDLWECLGVVFLPPCLSDTSRMRSSLSMRPAPRRTVAATERPLALGEGVTGL